MNEWASDLDGPDQTYKRDAGKPPLQLLPATAIIEVAEVMGYGADKYEPWSWRGLDPDRTLGSVLRHLFAYMQDETHDQESGHRHLAHAASQLLYLIEETHEQAT